MQAKLPHILPVLCAFLCLSFSFCVICVICGFLAVCQTTITSNSIALL